MIILKEFKNDSKIFISIKNAKNLIKVCFKKLGQKLDHILRYFLVFVRACFH